MRQTREKPPAAQQGHSHHAKCAWTPRGSVCVAEVVRARVVYCDSLGNDRMRRRTPYKPVLARAPISRYSTDSTGSTSASRSWVCIRVEAGWGVVWVGVRAFMHTSLMSPADYRYMSQCSQIKSICIGKAVPLFKFLRMVAPALIGGLNSIAFLYHLWAVIILSGTERCFIKASRLK